MTTDEEEVAAAFGRFVALIQELAAAGLAHPEDSGRERALFDIHRAATDLIEQLFEDADSAYGHCDTCGAPCDGHGCTADRAHLTAIDVTYPACHLCSYLALDVADLIEHHQLNHEEKR